MDLLRKLNHKNQKTIHIINYPTSFLNEIEEMKNYLNVLDIDQLDQMIEFVLVFVINTYEVKHFADMIIPITHDNTVIWFAYPKKSSKKYISDLTRDYGWDAVKSYGFGPVRQIAIDDDWSALRFRKKAEE